MNNKQIIRLLIGFLITMLLSACGQLFSQGDGSGSGTETTNALSGTLRDDKGNFLAYVQVKAFAYDEESFELIDSTRSDEKGQYQLNLIDGKYIVEAKRDSIAFFDTLSLASDTKLNAILTQPFNITVVLNEDFTDSIDLWFYPSTIQNQIAIGQGPQPLTVPRGNYLVYFKKYNADRTASVLLDIVEFNATNDADTLIWNGLHTWGNIGEVIFDNFEDGDHIHYNDLIWWTFDDTNSGHQSLLITPFSKDYLQYDLTLENKGWIDLKAKLDPSTDRAFVGLGTNFYRPLPKNNSALDLRNLKTLSLDMKLNSGKMRIGFRSKLTNGWSLYWDLNDENLSYDTLLNIQLSVSNAKIAKGYLETDIPFLLSINDEFMMNLGSDITGDSLNLIVDNFSFQFK